MLADVADGGKVLAGGQSLLPLLSMRLAAPAALVDINRLPDLDAESQVDETGVRVGCAGSPRGAGAGSLGISGDSAAAPGRAQRRASDDPQPRNDRRQHRPRRSGRRDDRRARRCLAARWNCAARPARVRSVRTTSSSPRWSPTCGRGSSLSRSYFSQTAARGPGRRGTRSRVGTVTTPCAASALLVTLGPDDRIQSARAGYISREQHADRARPHRCRGRDGRRRARGRRWVGGGQPARPGRNRPGGRHPRHRRVPSTARRRAHGPRGARCGPRLRATQISA